MNFLMVFIGGGLGSCLRYLISLWIPFKPPSFPWATLSANLASCFIIGCLIALLSKGQLSSHSKLLLITGFCGGFSTFSTFSLEIVQLVKYGAYGTSITYGLLSVVLGSVLVFLGSSMFQ